MSSHFSFQAAAELGDHDHDERPTKADLVRQALAKVREFDLADDANQYTDNECVVAETTEILEELLGWLDTARYPR